MQVPGSWETRGLPDFDGVVWFTRSVDCSGGSGADRAVARSCQQHRGSLGQRPVGHARAGAGRGAAPPRRRTRRRTAGLSVASRRDARRASTPSRCASRTTATTAASSACRRACSSTRARRAYRSPAPGATGSSVRRTRGRFTPSRASSRRTSPSPPAVALPVRPERACRRSRRRPRTSCCAWPWCPAR